MKISVISFSGRQGGNCSRIAEELCKSLSRTPNEEVKSYELSELTLTPCGGCGYECFEDREQCPYFGDSVFKLYEAVTESDLTYFIVPNYCDYPCSLFFAFNERGQCYFQKRQDRLDKYLAVKKKFIVVSNTNRDNFTAAFLYHVEETSEPDILFLEAKRFHKVSIRGDLMDSEEAREAVRQFAES